MFFDAFHFGEEIGIDLGTVNVIIYVKNKGIVFSEPSAVAFNRRTGEVIAVGREAEDMDGRTPGHMEVVHPLQDGVIADYATTEKMLSYFIRKAVGSFFIFKPRVIVCIPTGVTGVEERAVRQASLSAGAKQAYLIEEPVAAALGAGVDIEEAKGNMIVDIGGGTTDIAVMSLGGSVVSKSLRLGGNRINSSIVRYVRKKHSLLIGEKTAEKIKIAVGTVMPDVSADESLEIKGRDLSSGLPRELHISSEEIYPALREPSEQIINTIRDVLEKTPPEIAGDIMGKGIVLTGGGALLRGLPELITERTGLPVIVADDPLACVAKGTGIALERMDSVEKGLIYAKKVM